MPIRIAHVVEATTGGVARHVIDLVTHLDPAEFSCVLYLSFQRPESHREEWLALRDAGITLREIPMARLPNPSAVRQIAGWAGRDAIDLLHLHSAKAGYLGRQAAVDLQDSLQVVYTPHAFPFQRTTDWLHPLYRRIERRLAAQTARIICVSAGEAEEALDAGLPEEKLVVIPNGLDFAAWSPLAAQERREARAALGLAASEVVVGALARLTPQKGIDLLLEAWEDLAPDFPQGRFVIWGDGPERRALETLAKRLRLPRVVFAGATSAPRQAFAAMDIFCAPSRWEGAPYAVLEALACSLPVVATEVPGHTDFLVHGETGLLVEPDFPGPLAGALRGLLADQDERDALGAAGRAYIVPRFPLARMVEKTSALYRHIARS